MVDTIKFSEMINGGDIDNNKKTPGLKDGANVLFNNPWTFLAPGTTAQRPAPSADMYYRLRLNTDDQVYEYYNPILDQWVELEQAIFTNGPFVTYTEDSNLPDAQNLGDLANGLLKQTISMGIATLDIAIPGTDYFAPDVNNNLHVNNLILGFVSIPSAAGTSTLTVASPNIIEITGSTTQTVVMPVVSTLTGGQQFTIINNSSGNVTVNSSGGNTIQVMAPNTSLYLTCVLITGTTAASWNSSYVYENGAGVLTVNGTANQINVSASTGNVVLSLSSTLNMPGTFTIQSTTAISSILNENNMATNSATALATQSSIKYYADHLATLFDTNGNTTLSLVPVASAVNYLTISNSITSVAPVIVPAGLDNNIGIVINTKGDGTVNIKGAIDGSNASSGYWGEFVSSSVALGSAVSLTSSITATVTTISLSAGDWDITALVNNVPGAGTITSSLFCAINTSSSFPSALGDGSTSGYVGFNNMTGNANSQRVQAHPSLRLNVTGTTTVYLLTNSVFSISTQAVYGWISARRIR